MVKHVSSNLPLISASGLEGVKFRARCLACADITQLVVNSFARFR